MNRPDEIWKAAPIVTTFLRDVRGGIPYGADQIEIMMRVLAANERPIERFLDLGCGGGILTRAILARYPTATGTLVDFSEPMLENARAELSASAAQLSFISADFGVPDWGSALAGNEPFDAVVSAYAIHHQPDLRKRDLYSEIFDDLKPGGLFINIEHVLSHSRWVESLSESLTIDTLHEFGARRKGGKSREQVAAEFHSRPDRAANILAPVEDQCEWLRKIGFQDVDCCFKVFELAVFGGRKPAS